LTFAPFPGPHQNTHLQKDSIFARYRTLAEMLGVLLLRSAQAHNLNVLVETSGRDVAMFKYIDTFFPDETYRCSADLNPTHRTCS
jgi:hypothetical protein